MEKKKILYIYIYIYLFLIYIIVPEFCLSVIIIFKRKTF